MIPAWLKAWTMACCAALFGFGAEHVILGYRAAGGIVLCVIYGPALGLLWRSFWSAS